MRKLKIIIVLLLVLISCEKKEAEPGHLPFGTSKGIPIVNVMINGEYKRLLVDTGASFSLLDKDEAKKLGASFHKDDLNGSVTGIGGEVEQELISGIKVSYKDTILNTKFKAIDFPVGRKIGVIGVLGCDYFIKNNMVLDFQTRSIHKP